MAIRTLTIEDAINAVYGGCILGGGGGGWIKDGLEKAELVFEAGSPQLASETKDGLEKAELVFEAGSPQLASVEDLDEEDYVACVSLVGAPSAKDQYVSANHLVGTVVRMQKEFSKPLKALMTNENGAATTINGWLQAAVTGLPFLDAPCNGRAHPTGSMGSLNLSELEYYESIQTFSGGAGDKQMEGVVSASLDLSSSAIRAMSVQAGGMVGVCRNPVDIAYVKENAAIGGITQAIELGAAFLAAPEGPERIETAASFLKGRIIHSGKVSSFELKEVNGFDVGVVQIDDLELTFWNEYMTAEMNGERRGTFPDLIMTFNADTGMPIVSAEIERNMNIAVISVPLENLKLSSTMFNEKLLKAIEPIVGKQII